MDITCKRVNPKQRLQGEIDWYRNYRALLEYYKLHGHCNPTQKTKFQCEIPGLREDGGSIMYKGCLGSWLHFQRQSKRGNRTPLTPERHVLLQQLVDEGSIAIFVNNIFLQFCNIFFLLLFFLVGIYHSIFKIDLYTLGILILGKMHW